MTDMHQRDERSRKQKKVEKERERNEKKTQQHRWHYRDQWGNFQYDSQCYNIMTTWICMLYRIISYYIRIIYINMRLYRKIYPYFHIMVSFTNCLALCSGGICGFGIFFRFCSWFDKNLMRFLVDHVKAIHYKKKRWIFTSLPFKAIHGEKNWFAHRKKHAKTVKTYYHVWNWFGLCGIHSWYTFYYHYSIHMGA